MTGKLLQANELVGMKRYKDAEKLLRDVLADTPNSSEAHALLGVSLVNLGRGRESLRATEAAIGLDPEDGYAFYAHSFSLDACGQRHEAVEAIQEALRLDGTSAMYLQRLAIFHFYRREWRECLGVLDRALAISPGVLGCLSLRGKTLRELDRTQEAQEAFETALAFNPEYAEAHHALGAIQLSRGENGPALDHLLEARRLDPVYKNDHESIALALGRLLPPFRVLARLTPHWIQWPPVATTARIMSLILCCACVQGFLIGNNKSRAWLGQLLAIVVVNWLLLGLTFDQFATQTARMLRRKHVGASWQRLLRGLPMMAILIWVHFMAVSLGMLGLGVTMFLLAVLACKHFVFHANRTISVQGITSILYLAYGLMLCIAIGCSLEMLMYPGGLEVFAWIGIFALLAFLSNYVADSLERFDPAGDTRTRRRTKN